MKVYIILQDWGAYEPNEQIMKVVDSEEKASEYIKDKNDLWRYEEWEVE